MVRRSQILTIRVLPLFLIDKPETIDTLISALMTFWGSFQVIDIVIFELMVIRGVGRKACVYSPQKPKQKMPAKIPILRHTGLG